MYCENCKSQLEVEASFCSTCGKEVLRNDKEVVGETVTSIAFEEELQRSFVHKKDDYYQKKWSKMARGKKHASWNWAAFFLGPFWFGYRKMYLHVAGIALVYLLMDVVLSFTSDQPLNDFLTPGAGTLTAPFTFFIGLYSNTLYLQHTKRYIHKVNLKPYDSEQKKTWLKKKGGTSWVGVLIALIALILYTIVTTILFPTVEDKIATVKEGAFYTYPTVTIGEAFDDYFIAPEWEYISNDNQNEVVRFTGFVIRGARDIPVTMDFILTEDSFEIHKAMIFEEELSDEEINGFIDTIFTDNR